MELNTYQLLFYFIWGLHPVVFTVVMLREQCAVLGIEPELDEYKEISVLSPSLSF